MSDKTCRPIDGYAFAEYGFRVTDKNPGVDTDNDGRADEGDVGYMEQITDADDIDIAPMTYEATGQIRDGVGLGIGAKGCVDFLPKHNKDNYTDRFTQMYWRAALRFDRTSLQYGINNTPDVSIYNDMTSSDLLFDRAFNTVGFTVGAGLGPLYVGGNFMWGQSELQGSNGADRFMTPNGYFYPGSGYKQQAAWVNAQGIEFALSPRPVLLESWVKNPDRGNVEFVMEARRYNINQAHNNITNPDQESMLYREEDDVPLRTDVYSGTQPDDGSAGETDYTVNMGLLKMRLSF
jgi:hypothetical protein